MKTFTITKGILFRIALSVTPLAPLVTLADTEKLSINKFGALSYETSNDKITIFSNGKKIYSADNTVGVQLLKSSETTHASYELVGLSSSGNCCPWFHVLLIESNSKNSTVYDTKTDVYPDNLQNIIIKDNIPKIQLKGVVGGNSNLVEFEFSNGSFSTPKDKPEKYSEKSCKSLYEIYKAECPPREGYSCADAALLRYSEIDYLSKKTGVKTSTFFDACRTTCVANKVEEFVEFSSLTCKNQ